MTDLQFAWLFIAIGVSSGTLGGFVISLIGLYGLWASKDDPR